MIVIVLVLVVGMLFGGVLADRMFQSGASTASRRALDQLEYTLGGLETAYSMKAAWLTAQREVASQPGLTGDGAGDLDERVLHLPQRRR
jgi:hypothetical protein